MNNRRVYEEVRQIVEGLGGKMYHRQSGYHWGAWIVRLNGKERIFRSNGSGYPELDGLYRPKPGHPNPNHYEHYSTTLLPDARERLERLLSQAADYQNLSAE